MTLHVEIITFLAMREPALRVLNEATTDVHLSSYKKCLTWEGSLVLYFATFLKEGMKTYSPKPHEVKRDWHVVDASTAPLGRLATQISLMLRGKHKPTFAPHTDAGDFVIVVNAKNAVLTGLKKEQKTYQHFTGYPGGLRHTSFSALMEKSPEKVIFFAVKRMMPDNKLSDTLLTKLKIYPGPEHPHVAQAPKPLNLAGKKAS